jgi:Domain of unknown function (DUF4349)
MNTSSHAVTSEEVMAHVDRELPSIWGEFVAEHVAGCGECARIAAQVRTASEGLRAWRVETMPEKVEATTSRLPVSRRLRPIWWALGFAAVAATPFLLDHVGQKRYTASPSKSVQLLSSAPTAPAGDALRYAGSVAQEPFVVSALEPMIARTVSLAIVVRDLPASRAALEEILAGHHSYAADLTANTPENVAQSLQASLRIPAPELAATIGELKSLGSVENETQNGEEVTQQHADLVARLKNSRETERRLEAILAKRTGKISDVLEVEREIARVRGEIEQMEAEQTALEHRVEFATVNLRLTEEYKARLVRPSPSVSTRVHNALVAGSQNATETILAVVLFFAEFGPSLAIWLAILALPVVVLWRRYRRALATV